MSRRCNLAAYDVAYLNVTKGANLALATSDGPLRTAARAEGIVLI
jgi:predicted nucleic acid-binding protein